MKHFVLLFLLAFSMPTFAQNYPENPEPLDEFDRLIQEADSTFKLSQYLKAKKLYEEALSFVESQYARRMIDECSSEKWCSWGCGYSQYTKIINYADKQYELGNFERAKEVYQRAALINSRDQHPKEMIECIESVLQKKTD